MAFIQNQGVAPKGERYDRSSLVNDTENKLYKQTEYGDFIYSSNNLETGSIGLNKYGKACISPVYSIFSPTGIADSDFIGRRFVRKDFINEMVKWRQGVIYGQWRIHESDFLKIDITVPSLPEQRKIGDFLDKLDNLITLHQREDLAQISPDKDLITISTSLFSNSWMMCRYVFWVVVILACPRRLATLAIETPANNSNEAWVCLKPWIEMTGIFRDKQCLFKISFTVELYTLFCAKNGASSGKPFKSSENCTTVCQSICIFLTEDLFFVGKKPPSDL